MKMKIPNNGGIGSNYYNHDVGIFQYASDSDSSDELDSPTLNGDFSEYMWMENEEEFDEQVMKQLEEEALMEQCIEAMLEEEREMLGNNPVGNNVAPNAPRSTWSTGDSNSGNIVNSMGSLKISDDVAKKSTLNPNATEFVPRQRTTPVVEIEGKV